MDTVEDTDTIVRRFADFLVYEYCNYASAPQLAITTLDWVQSVDDTEELEPIDIIQLARGGLKAATLDWIKPVEAMETDMEVDRGEASPIDTPRQFSVKTTLDLTALKLYKLRGESVVRVTDIPKECVGGKLPPDTLRLDLPADIKRYKLRGQDVVKLAALEQLA